MSSVISCSLVCSHLWLYVHHAGCVTSYTIIPWLISERYDNAIALTTSSDVCTSSPGIYASPNSASRKSFASSLHVNSFTSWRVGSSSSGCVTGFHLLIVLLFFSGVSVPCFSPVSSSLLPVSLEMFSFILLQSNMFRFQYASSSVFTTWILVISPDLNSLLFSIVTG